MGTTSTLVPVLTATKELIVMVRLLNCLWNYQLCFVTVKVVRCSNLILSYFTICFDLSRNQLRLRQHYLSEWRKLYLCQRNPQRCLQMSQQFRRTVL